MLIDLDVPPVSAPERARPLPWRRLRALASLLTPSVFYTAHLAGDGLEIVARPLAAGVPSWHATVAADVGVIELRTGAVYGSLPGISPFGCTAAGDHLACLADGVTTAVWRVR
ncbi:hypothetical protein [Actinoplanes sp. NPDC051851]|uniref:hypothetical protein n=1 Tax=Actinoplanes sp. NPDC051851 TaxID=3154753 RepID=UPI00343FA7D3